MIYSLYFENQDWTFVYLNYLYFFIRKRQIYDQVGEEGLKNGAGAETAGSGGGMGGMPNFQYQAGPGGNFQYAYHGDPRATFAQFFGTSGMRIILVKIFCCLAGESAPLSCDKSHV